MLLMVKKGAAQKIVYGAFNRVEEEERQAGSGSLRRGYEQHHALFWRLRTKQYRWCYLSGPIEG